MFLGDQDPESRTLASLENVGTVEPVVVSRDNRRDSSNSEIVISATSLETRGNMIRDCEDVCGVGVLSRPRERSINDRNTGLYCLVVSHCPWRIVLSGVVEKPSFRRAAIVGSSSWRRKSAAKRSLAS